MTGTPERTALYRIWGEAGLLLYIGVSKNFGQRWKQHAKEQPWWDEMKRLTADEWFEDRKDAEAAEVAAIKAEGPKYNIVHAAGPPRRRNPYRVPEEAAPAMIPVRIPEWENAPVHFLDKWMRPGHSMAELTLSHPATAEAIIAGLPEDRREVARLRLESWRLEARLLGDLEGILKGLCALERVTDKPELLAVVRQGKATVRGLLKIPCPTCGGEPAAGMDCRECGASGGAPLPRTGLRPFRGIAAIEAPKREDVA